MIDAISKLWDAVAMCCSVVYRAASACDELAACAEDGAKRYRSDLVAGYETDK